jgi:hypothetical protein
MIRRIYYFLGHFLNSNHREGSSVSKSFLLLYDDMLVDKPLAH